MRDYLNIGCVPAAENCAQVGSPDYPEKARKECAAFLRQLRRQFGEEPFGAQLKIKSFPHDFGTYYEVVCYYFEEEEESQNYAFKLENEMPENWDKEAKEELGLS